jgi:hypothetical protein
MKKKPKIKLIKIKITYSDKNLQQITGKKSELIKVPQDFKSGVFFDLLQERYPEMFKKFGPGYLGFTLNEKKPNALTQLQDGDHYELITWTDEEILIDESLKCFKEKGRAMEISKENFKMPKWMECAWRRVPCGKDDCPICGRIKKDRRQHIERGEDPDNIQSVFEDISRNFKETFEMVKRDSQRMGIDITNIENIQEPPEPEEFPFYQKAEEWNKEVFKIANEAKLSGEWWINTEAAADLFWYANTLLAKVYRQLCNRWHIKNGDDYGDFDYQYTKYVLEECLKLLKKSLRELISFDSAQKVNLILVHDQMIKLEEDIFKI